MTLIVHRAERADLLVPGLAAVLREPQADPFAMELVLVPARGVERWLSQQLSHLLGNAPGSADGVCAGVEFRSPASLIAEVLGTRNEDPWHPDVLAWSVLRVLDRSVGEPWARVVVNHLGYLFEPGSDEFVLRQGRRFAVARRLAGLLAAYAGQRPHLLVDWEAGGNGDGTGRALPADLAWQPELWRRVLADVGAPSPVVRHRDVVAALSSGSLALDLPPRLSLFGHTRLSRSRVNCWLLSVSDARSTCGCRIPAMRSGPRARCRRWAPVDWTTSLTSRSSIRCWRRWGATCVRRRRCSKRCMPAMAGRCPGRRDRAPCLARSRPTSPQPERRDRQSAWARTQAYAGRSKCTPVMARPVRSRCCVRCCSICWMPIPLWSHATSW